MKLCAPSGLFLALIAFLTPISSAQQPPQPSAAQHVLRAQSSLVLVDVITQDHKTALPVRDFKKEDFRMFDNNHEVAITSFHAGAHYDTRPIVLWLVVFCNEGGKIGGVADFVGNVARLRPALDYLDKQDTVGVAHWCDNGEAQLDLLPTEDKDRVIEVMTQTIRPIPFQVGGYNILDTNRVGGDDFRRLIRLIIQNAHSRNPEPLPAIVFLDGDYTGQPRWKFERVVDDFLEASGIVFGIMNNSSPPAPQMRSDKIARIEHYMADETGGQFFSEPRSEYALALEAILVQLHFRYELGFIPPVIDGKRHSIKVELAKEDEENHKGVRLRYRSEYIPVPEAPAWTR